MTSTNNNNNSSNSNDKIESGMKNIRLNGTIFV